MKEEIPIFLTQELEYIYQAIHRLEQEPESLGADPFDWRESCMFARLLLGTGVRINEARKIKASDCANGCICVREGKGKKLRWVEASPEFKPHLERYLHQIAHKGPNSPLFPGKQYRTRQEGVSLRTARRWWTDILRIAGVRHLGPHKARATYATIEAKLERLSLQDVKEQLGHTDVATTLGYYAKSLPGYRYGKPDTAWMATALKL